MATLPTNCTPRQLTAQDICEMDLALELTLANEMIVSQRADILTYRGLMVEALHALAAATQERDHLRDQLRALRNEYRGVRAQMMAGASEQRAAA